MKKFSLFIYNTIITASTSICLNVITIIFNIYLTNILSNSILGIYNLILSIHYFLVTITTFGTNYAITKTIAEELALNNIKITNSTLSIAKENLKLIYHPYMRSKLNKVIKIGFKITFIFSILSISLLTIFMPTIIKTYLHDQVTCVPLYILSVSLPLIGFSCVLHGYFAGIRKASVISICRFIEEITQFSIIIILTHFFSYNTQLIFIILSIALTISELISFISLFIIYYKDNKKAYSFSLNTLSSFANTKTNFSKKINNICFPIGLTTIFKSGLQTIKQLLIPIGLKKFGMNLKTVFASYGIITSIVLPLILFPNIIIASISNLLIPEISQYYIHKDYESINYIINKVFKITFNFSIILTGFFYLFSNKLTILLYPNKSTSEISLYIKILCPIILFIYLDNIIDNILKGINKQLIVMLTNILDLIISIALIYFVLPTKGVNGYILIIFISEFLNFTISFFELKHDIHFKFNIKEFILYPTIITLFTSYIIYLLSYFILDIHDINNFIILAIEASLYFLFIILFYTLSKKQKNKVS